MKTTYSYIHPNRINPEFIGIGSRYVEEKMRRKTEEKLKKSNEMYYLSSVKIDRHLEKNISRKSLELTRLQETRYIKSNTEKQVIFDLSREKSFIDEKWTK